MTERRRVAVLSRSNGTSPFEPHPVRKVRGQGWGTQYSGTPSFHPVTKKQ